MIFNALLLALRQIFRNPMRSLLTVLGVVIGVAAVITMVTIGNGATVSIRQQIESFGNNQILLLPGQRLGPGQKIGAPDFRVEDVSALEHQIAGIVKAAPIVSKSMTVVANGKNWSTNIIGTNTDYFNIDNRELAVGRFFEDGEEASGSAVCVIGSTIAKELFGDSTAGYDQLIRTGNFSCRVIGITKTRGSAAMGGDQDDFIVMPLKTVQRRLLGETKVSQIVTLIDANSDRDRIKNAITELMRERRSLSSGDDDNFSIRDTAEIAEKVTTSTRILTQLFGAVASVSLLVGGVGIMNIMLVSVTERTREIGIRLAIGALGREVMLQFLIEALMLGCLGGLMGVLLAVVFSQILCALLQVPYSFDMMINLIAFVVSALIGVIFGFFPARRAARLDPIEAVRHE